MLTKTIVFVLVLHCAFSSPLKYKKVPCSYNDEECLSEATKAIYPTIVAGRPGEVEASDPLYLEEVNLKVSDLKYVLSNAKMTGLLNCSVKDVLVTPEKAFFNYYIWCPSLTIESNYEASGELDSTVVQGKGTNKIGYKNYDIWLKGNYDKFIDAAGDLHTQIVNFIIEIRVDEVTKEYTGLCFGNNECADPSEENLKQLETQIREPLMYKFLQKYVKNLNAFIKIVPVKDIHYKIVEEYEN